LLDFCPILFENKFGGLVSFGNTIRVYGTWNITDRSAFPTLCNKRPDCTGDKGSLREGFFVAKKFRRVHRLWFHS